MGYIEKTYGRSEKFLAFKVCFYDTLATLAVQRWLEQRLVAE